MKKKRVTNSWSKNNLPEDLWPEILSRLPVKSLLQFRCVSKSWLSVIDNPEFCRLRLNCFKNNCHETHLFVVQGEKNEQHCVVRCSKTFRNTMRLGSLRSDNGCTNAFITSPKLADVKKWDVICLIDVLAVLKNSRIMPTPELMLWNPSIRKARSVLTWPEISSGMMNVDLALGFDPLIKDYKHVRLVCHGESGLHCVAVYTVGTGLWKTTQFEGKGCSSWCWSSDFSYVRETIFYRCGLYFIARNLNSNSLELVSFDLSSEVFAFTNLPACDNPIPRGYQHYTPILVDGGYSLAVCHIFRGSIWVLERSRVVTKSMYWTKR